MIPHIVLREIRDFPIPVPPLHEQLKIVQRLETLHASLSHAWKLKCASNKELDAMLPSILDRAFKGAL